MHSDVYKVNEHSIPVWYECITLTNDYKIHICFLHMYIWSRWVLIHKHMLNTNTTQFNRQKIGLAESPLCDRHDPHTIYRNNPNNSRGGSH
jgi:hypothetical protein